MSGRLDGELIVLILDFRGDSRKATVDFNSEFFHVIVSFRFYKYLTCRRPI